MKSKKIKKKFKHRLKKWVLLKIQQLEKGLIMPVTQTDIDNLNAAITQGEKVVRQGDKWVEYRSVDQLMKARDDMQRQLNSQSQRSRIVYHTQSSRGY